MIIVSLFAHISDAEAGDFVLVKIPVESSNTFKRYIAEVGSSNHLIVRHALVDIYLINGKYKSPIIGHLVLPSVTGGSC